MFREVHKMITDEHTLAEILPSAQDGLEEYLRLCTLAEDVLFFDIETTGFKASASHLYMIGCAFQDKAGAWKIRQYMSVRPEEEAKLLRSFRELLSHFSVLVHFNGNRFDIPYMKEKYEQYGLPSPFDTIASVDIYQDVRGLRKFLNLSHMNQKFLEVFLGRQREDEYDGGRLIAVYRKFCLTGDDGLLHLLLLHNREDVAGMFLLIRMYAYTDFFRSLGPDTAVLSEDTPAVENSVSGHSSGSARFRAEISEHPDEAFDLIFRCTLASPVPVPVTRQHGSALLMLKDKTASLLMPLWRGDMLYFFENYRDYYYLPEEDRAIHKSVSGYVGRPYRKNATPQNCYEHVRGVFLPQPQPAVYQPVFRKSYEDSTAWLKLSREDLANGEFLNDYARLVIRTLFLSPAR